MGWKFSRKHFSSFYLLSLADFLRWRMHEKSTKIYSSCYRQLFEVVSRRKGDFLRCFHAKNFRLRVLIMEASKILYLLTAARWQQTFWKLSSLTPETIETTMLKYCLTAGSCIGRGGGANKGRGKRAAHPSLVQNGPRAPIKKKRKHYSYIRKFRVEQLQSHTVYD
jgi:hypothetical protein